MRQISSSRTPRPVWLIEADLFGPEIEPLLTAVHWHGMTTVVIPYRALKDPSIAVGDEVLGDDDCVIARGTFPFSREVQLHRRWMPGAWADPAALDCTAYYPPLAEHLLNRHRTILLGTEAISRRDQLFAEFEVDGEMFVRPTGCDKLFTGRRVSRDAFATALAPSRYDPATSVVVASPRTIEREWRLLVAGDRVVAASQYADHGTKSLHAGCPDDVWAFANAVLASVAYRPDPVFFLDVGESDGRAWVVELSGFVCCGLYCCDPEAVVSAVAVEALKVWNNHRHEPDTVAGLAIRKK